MSFTDEDRMRLAIAEAERARGSTGDNPWVGCVMVHGNGQVFARGYTRGPGDDHAEIVAIREAQAAGLDVTGATLYSTLEPCSFHGRTPACSRVIIEHRIGRVVTAMRDPNPRVDGEGARLLREGGVDVTEGICEREVRQQLGSWVFAYHPHEPRARARAWLATLTRSEILATLIDTYAVDATSAEQVLAELESAAPLA